MSWRIHPLASCGVDARFQFLQLDRAKVNKQRMLASFSVV
jgi:hypothetical protein